MNTDNPFKILFLCNSNSARSLMAEYLIRRIAPLKFESYSAATGTVQGVHPFALRVLMDLYKVDASSARSKPVAELHVPKFDFVITVCDEAKEQCPTFPGQPMVSHWVSEDPTLAEGTDDEKFYRFRIVAQQIHRRLDLFCSLSFDKLDRLRVQELMKDISYVGKQAGATGPLPTVA